VYPQLFVAFQIRHLVEHRNGRIDGTFIKRMSNRDGSPSSLWKNSTWGRAWPLKVNEKIPVEIEDVQSLATAATQGADAMASAFLQWPQRHLEHARNR
jgi:hypothetical protein